MDDHYSPLLSVRDLTISYGGPKMGVRLVDGISYDINRAEIVGMAGESGSGKTVASVGMMGLLGGALRVSGEVRLEGMNLLDLPPKRFRDVRGKRIAMIFQDPRTSLHPMLTIKQQLTEHARRHLGLSRKQATERAVDLLREVRVPDPSGAMRLLPHHFSGGLRQRLAIASALACDPQLLIADEPTTDLDVTVQAGILRLLSRLRESRGLSVLLITHDLGVMAALADRLLVLYSGRIVEQGTTGQVLRGARHPYTDGLLRALPRKLEGRGELVPMVGMPPHPGDRPTGCPFHPRCAYAQEVCLHDPTALRDVDTDHQSACIVDPLVAVRSR